MGFESRLPLFWDHFFPEKRKLSGNIIPPNIGVTNRTFYTRGSTFIGPTLRGAQPTGFDPEILALMAMWNLGPPEDWRYRALGGFTQSTRRCGWRNTFRGHPSDRERGAPLFFCWGGGHPLSGVFLPGREGGGDLEQHSPRG